LPRRWAPGELLELLGPMWAEKHETGKRLVQRVGAVFDFAAGAGIWQGPNPTQGLRRALPKVRAQVENFAAMPWQDVPTLWGAMSDTSMTARALGFLILTAARPGEVRGARWAEIDREAGLWTIPAERMKGREAHTVPLAPPAVALLRAVEGYGDELVFPSPQAARRGPAERPLSAAGFERVLSRHGAGAFTAHGFRTSFRTWAAEVAGADREVAELCLAHRIGNKVEQAYNRTSLLDRRRVLMTRWAEHVTGAAGARVVHLR
jgi:integrase